MGIVERRQLLGRRIKRARQRAGFDSQQKFANHIGIDKSSVAHAESGSDRIAIDGKSFAAIEDGLGWPEDCISRYLATGDESLLPQATEGAANPPPLTEEQQQLKAVYEFYLGKYGPTEALARISRDVDEINAARERRSRAAG